MSESSEEMSSLKKKDKIQNKREVVKPKSSFVTTRKIIHTISHRERLLRASDKQIPNSETTIVQLAEGSIWTERTVQLAKRASWIEQAVQRASWIEQAVQLAERGSWIEQAIQLAEWASWIELAIQLAERATLQENTSLARKFNEEK